MKKIYSLLLFMGILFVSCADFLDREPITVPNSATYLSSQAQITNYVNGLYMAIPSFATYGMGVLGAEDNSDNVLATNYNERLNGLLKAETGSTSDWSSGYKNLRGVNYFFEYYNVKEIDETEDILSLKGEVYFLRAWWHYHLLTRFGSVPVMDGFWDANANLDGLQIPAKNRWEVAQFILDDLNTAKELLHPRKKYSGLRICKEAALIMAMRVALYEGTWEKYHKGTDFAASEDKSTYFLEQVMTLGDELFGMGLELNTIDNDPFIKDKTKSSVGDAFAHLFNQSDLSAISEAVFWKKYSTEDGLENRVMELLSSGATSDSGPAGITQSLIDNYLNADGTFIDPNDDKFKDYIELFKDRDGRLLQTVMHDGCKYKSSSKGAHPMKIAEYREGDDEETKKYNEMISPPYLLNTGKSKNITGYAVRLSIDTTYVTGMHETPLCFIRYAEALLSYAEAAEELGRCNDDVLNKTLKPLRERAGVTYVKPSKIDPNFTNFGYSLTPNLQEIRRDRRSEFAMQGYRLDDLMRWKAHPLITGKRGRGVYIGSESTLYKCYSPENQEEIDKMLTTDKCLDPLKDLLPNGYQFNPQRDYLMPIPTGELQLNHKLNQNPGWLKQ